MSPNWLKRRRNGGGEGRTNAEIKFAITRAWYAHMIFQVFVRIIFDGRMRYRRAPSRDANSQYSQTNADPPILIVQQLTYDPLNVPRTHARTRAAGAS